MTLPDLLKLDRRSGTLTFRAPALCISRMRGAGFSRPDAVATWYLSASFTVAMKDVNQDSTFPSHFTGCKENKDTMIQSTFLCILRFSEEIIQCTRSLYLSEREFFTERAFDANDVEVRAFTVLHLTMYESADVGEEFVDVEVDLRQVVAVADDVHDVIDGEEVESREELALAFEMREERLATDFQVEVHLLEDAANI